MRAARTLESGRAGEGGGGHASFRVCRWEDMGRGVSSQRGCMAEVVLDIRRGLGAWDAIRAVWMAAPAPEREFEFAFHVIGPCLSVTHTHASHRPVRTDDARDGMMPWKSDSGQADIRCPCRAWALGSRSRRQQTARCDGRLCALSPNPRLTQTPAWVSEIKVARPGVLRARETRFEQLP
jgi:hypothetical protein